MRHMGKEVETELGELLFHLHLLMDMETFHSVAIDTIAYDTYYNKV